jgi:antibiotic biosynthesis monooxygenase (ABM) superfamily enzyme
VVPVVEHLVLLKPKPGTPDPALDELVGLLRGLRERVPGILSLEAGRNISPDRARGFAIGLHVRFPDRQALAAYGPHPEHQRVVQRIQELCDEVLVVDFEA